MADQIVVSESALGYLNATRPWVKFLAILGFVFIALMIIAGLFMTFAFSMVADKPGMSTLGPLFGIVYIVFSALYFMPCLFLYRYSKAIAAIPSVGQSAMDDALKNQKSFWKFIGILTLVVLCVEAVFLLISILGGVMIGMGHHA